MWLPPPQCLMSGCHGNHFVVIAAMSEKASGAPWCKEKVSLLIAQQLDGVILYQNIQMAFLSVCFLSGII